LIHLGVVKALEKMDLTRTAGGNAAPNSACVLGVCARHERGGLIMANLKKPNLTLFLPKRLKHSIYPISWNSEDRINSPIE
jgi:hypothetical protein